MQINVLASGSSGNAYLLGDGQTTLLLDAGISFKEMQIKSGFKVGGVTGCLITHEHMDHCRSVKDLVKNGINVYMSLGTKEVLKVDSHRIKVIKSMNDFTVGTFIVKPFDVEHDVKEPLGFLITSIVTGERLVYFTDTYYLKYKFEGLNYILGECNYDNESLNMSIANGLNIERAKRLFKSHMSLENFVEFLKNNDLSALKKIYLLHLSSENSNEKKMKIEVQKLTGVEVIVC